MTASDTRVNSLDLDQPVTFHELTFLDEGEETTVGRPDVESYCVLPADGGSLLRRLADGLPPAAAARWYAETYGEQVDIVEFLEAMDELEFVAIGDEAPAGLRGRLRWSRLGKALFSPIAWICYGGLILAAIVAMDRHRDLVPTYGHLFFTQYLTIVTLVAFVGQIPFSLIHEAFHALAGRRLGINSRLRLSRRFYFLVLETSLDGLVAVPRRKRFLPMFAGMLADLVIIAILTLVAELTRNPDGSQPLVGAICLALAFTNIPRFLWQFYFYLQTDLYQVVVTMLGCVDLQRTTRRLIANKLNRILGRPGLVVDETTFHPKDRAVARWYAWLLIGGYAASTATLIFIVLPTLFRAFSIAIDHVATGNVTAASVTDALVFLLITLGQFIGAGVIAIRQRRQKRRAAAARHVID